jgi:hypothetical protein
MTTKRVQALVLATAAAPALPLTSDWDPGNGLTRNCSSSCTEGAI